MQILYVIDRLTSDRSLRPHGVYSAIAVSNFIAFILYFFRYWVDLYECVDTRVLWKGENYVAFINVVTSNLS